MFKIIGELKGTKADNVLALINIVEESIQLNKTAMAKLALYPEGHSGYDRIDFIEDGEGTLYVGRVVGKAGASISSTGKVSHVTMVDYVKHLNNGEQVEVTNETVDYIGTKWYKVAPVNTVKTEEVEQPKEEIAEVIEEPFNVEASNVMQEEPKPLTSGVPFTF